ncbi:hypothetical protein Hypma_001908 [Hypsizygus marmoreus]|uniref:Uncharacterized protein n=1 Tax=Hypsizygus marmoreus TaxID=39966 RepID=A0A369J6T3_HYPMA|nr:hypothetical protein Hypma_001908 [Hypsizygus marmoreus]
MLSTFLATRAYYRPLTDGHGVWMPSRLLISQAHPYFQSLFFKDLRYSDFRTLVFQEIELKPCKGCRIFSASTWASSAPLWSRRSTADAMRGSRKAVLLLEHTPLITSANLAGVSRKLMLPWIVFYSSTVGVRLFDFSTLSFLAYIIKFIQVVCTAQTSVSQISTYIHGSNGQQYLSCAEITKVDLNT